MVLRAATVHVVVNPAAGHGKAPAFVEEHVESLLATLEIPYKLYTTAAPLDAGEIARSIYDALSPSSGESRVPVILAGGDGTAHEFMEGVLGQDGVTWDLIPLPLGTANALFSSLFPPHLKSSHIAKASDLLDQLPERPPEEVIYLLSSLLRYLDNHRPVPLPITHTTSLRSASPGKPAEPAERLASHVVLSTALHAAILDSSESLRPEHPGPERFRIAAQANVTRFFPATAVLYPPSGSGGKVEQWSPAHGRWTEPVTANDRNDGTHHVEGPFSYFLSTATCDRLEPAFVISPLTTLQSDKETDHSYLYITILRPFRDPLFQATPVEAKRDMWSKRAFEVIGKAYQEGAHVNLTLPVNFPASDGVNAPQKKVEDYPLEDKGSGGPVVEVFRVGGFDWIPDQSTVTDSSYDVGDSGLICADGAIHHLPPGGQAQVRLASPSVRNGFFVCA
ncbi:hypothetical protein IAU60_006115 [Kwoniella sp. DSM 27419]